jgi:iron complex outermembrane receptor protein
MRSALAIGASVLALASPAAAQSVDSGEIVVTATRRAENVQDVPIAVSVLGEEILDATGTSTIAQVTQLQPTVQFISSNSRNTSTLIRGLGSNYGLTNDGLELGVGIYVDDVYYARPGSATLDYFDIERVEILRGPQGTLFGKNTTAGAINIITRAPSFEPEGSVEFSVGDYNFTQARGTFSGPITENLAGRITLGLVERDGFLTNVNTGENVNSISNRSVRAQLLYEPSEAFNIRWSADYDEQDPNAATQVFVRYGQTLRPAARQFPALAAHFGYEPASLDPYARLTDVDAPIAAHQRIYGTSLNANWDLGFANLTSVTAYRGWEWDPSNDRDYMALDVRARSQNPSQQNQWSQEFRLTSPGDGAIDWVAGLYAFGQEVETTGTEEYGADAAYWLIGPSVPANLLDGYAANTYVFSTTDSYAAFGEATWHATERLHLTAGLRYTTEEKTVYYDQTVSGGLDTTGNTTLTNAKLGIARPQFYEASLEDSSPSWRASVAYDVTQDILLYATVSNGYKSGGLNAAGIPTAPDGSPSLVSAIIDPEENTTYELGFKSQFFNRALTFNVAAYYTEVSDYQANVVDAGPGAIRGYLANIESVEVQGVELEARFNPTQTFTAYGTLAWTDGVYASFPNAPCPLELQSSSTSVCDISGARLPGVSEWVASLGGEYRVPAALFSLQGEYFFGADASYRSNWFADASSSIYTEIDPSTLLNLRVGYRSEGGTDAYISVRNATDEEYLLFTTVQAGNSGAIYGTPGDPRTIAFTVRHAF